MPTHKPVRPAAGMSLVLPRVEDASTQRALDQIALVMRQVLRRSPQTVELFTPTSDGTVPASGGGTAAFLRADGTWIAPPGGGSVADGDYGDVTVTSGGAVWTVDALPESRITGLVADLAAKVPVARSIAATSPVRIDGGASASLAADRTLSLDITALIAAIQALIALNAGQFGTGNDGSVTFDGATAVAGYSGPVANVYTATRSAHFINCTVASGVTVNQHSVPGPFIRGTGAGPGKIRWSGASAVGQTAGAAPTPVGPLPVGTSGGAGGNANSVGSPGNSISQGPQAFDTTSAPGGVGGFPPTNPTAGGIGHGGGGGASNANGGFGGVVVTSAVLQGWWEVKESAFTGMLPGNVVTPIKMGCATGGGGGAGGGGAGVGGGAGAGGSWGAIWCYHFDPVNVLVLESTGGSGANAVAATGVNQSGGGGGGAGSGGVIVIMTADASPPYSAASASTICAGGTPGSGSAGTGTGPPGTNGAAGGAGLVRIYN